MGIKKRHLTGLDVARGLRNAPDWYVRRILRDLYPVRGAAEGRLAKMGFKREDTFGTPATLTGSKVAKGPYWFMIHSDTVSTKIEEVIPPQLTGYMDEAPSYLGTAEHAGQVPANVYPDWIGLALLSYGNDSIIGSVTNATFTLSAAGSGGHLASGSIYVQIAPIYGGVVNSATGGFTGVLGPATVEQTHTTAALDEVTVDATADPVPGVTPTGYAVFYTQVGTGVESLMVVFPYASRATMLIDSTTSGALDANGNMVVASTPPASMGTLYNHQYDPRQSNWGTGSVMQPFTFIEDRDFAQAFQLTGTAIGKLMFEWGAKPGAEKALKATMDLIGKHLDRVLSINSTNYTSFGSGYEPYANLPLWRQCNISIGGSSYLTIQDLKIDMDYGIEGKSYIDGTNEIHSIVAKGPRIIHVTGTVLADDAQFTDYANRTRRDWIIAFEMPNGMLLQFELPQVQFVSYPIEVQGYQELMTTFAAKAKFDPNVAKTPARINLVNDVATAYSA